MKQGCIGMEEAYLKEMDGMVYYWSLIQELISQRLT